MAAGTEISLVVLTADDDDAGYRRGLRNVRQGDDRPDRRTAEALDHLHINRQRGLVHAGDHQRSVEEAKQRGTDWREAAGHQVTDREGHAVANHAAKRTDKGVRQNTARSASRPGPPPDRGNPARCASGASQ